MRRISVFTVPLLLLGPWSRAGVILLLSFFAQSLSPSDSLADVRISNMNNIGLGSWSGSGDVSDEDGVCIFNDGGPNYLITASGTGSGGSFRLTDSGNEVEFNVRFKGSSGGFTSLSPNSSHSFSAADQSDSNCSGGTNATIEISVSESDLLAAHKGSYSGTLNLQVDPN